MGDAELMDVVDEHDRVLCQVTKKEIYTRKLPHRIVHVFILHPTTRAILFQRRSEHMSYMPNTWCTSAAGHVGAGETYADAAQRELYEELQIRGELTHLGVVPFLLDHHFRFMHVFIGYAEDGFVLSEREVKEVRFFSLRDAQELVAQQQDIHPQLPPCFALLEKTLFSRV